MLATPPQGPALASAEPPSPPSCPLPGSDARAIERRGRFWLFGSFVFCPCHLPLTLGVLALLFGGTAAGVAIRAHALLAGALVTAVWLLGTARGFVLIHRAKSCATCRPTPAPADLASSAEVR